jgi:hypothetical protein
MEVCDKPLGYVPFGFADIWKGNYHGEPVCIKAVRETKPISLRAIKKMCGYFYIGRTKRASFETFSSGRKPISHPNVLPIIRVSKTLFPLCTMSPWMPDGNIAQYTQMNPDADRPMLVRTHQPEA